MGVGMDQWGSRGDVVLHSMFGDRAVEKVGLVRSGNSPSRWENSLEAVSAHDSVVVGRLLSMQGIEQKSSAFTSLWFFMSTNRPLGLATFATTKSQVNCCPWKHNAMCHLP
ncbi:hypothetical protein AAFF_G00011330 [Aldrovandia affinis]|uniref:Uncharacterized protein n=1 Tax=Aldrovandia affinis TaxID=143900 RepID=A0AAD7WIB4_9TELE|nr:hypothetical protein AAFF_G00011330 [Aldrovandia affinis]